MRVAFLPGEFPMLSETPVLNQITGLVARGHEVDIFGDRPRGGTYHPSIDSFKLQDHTWYRPDLPATTWGRWRRAWQLYAAAAPESRGPLLRSMNILRFGTRAATGRLPLQTAQFLPPRRFDIIQAGFGEQGLKALRMLKVGAISGPLLTAFRGADLTRFVRSRGNRVYAGLFQAGDRFLPVCQTFAVRLARMGCPPERIVVHRTGIDVARFAFKPRSPSDRLALISIGRLTEKKGLHDAIAAFAALKQSGAGADYTIVGDGPERAALEAQARELGVADSLHFAGALPQQQVLERLSRSDVLMAPSVTATDGDEEGIPNVLKEAMAVGVLVVSTRHSGIPELVEDGETGFLVAEHDVPGLAGKLKLIGGKPDVWAGIQVAARRRIEAEYDIERLNDQLVSLYQNLLRYHSPAIP
jgi:colanic acid/amylovoran biosynthesis glycosyltransferase